MTTFSLTNLRENVENLLVPVADAIWDEKILNVLSEIGISGDRIAQYLRDNDAESLDVCIRCAMLGEVYGEIEEHFSDRVCDCE